ncbi:hypothetical protein HMPREF1863_01721 [Aedoeadaptatus coxii]|uniref:Uncharacterized protein n=1 Tax=Aedoeadaptatus coxii TaxID=755172 RepID=A0A134ABW8_9FIRM|nr:hypothetical protein HMPREF1863_01721 [Peptoniphilus coxii]
MKIAVNTPMGTPIIIEPKVTITEPKIMGKIPKLAGVDVGRHSFPRIKWLGPVFKIKGTPFLKIK